MAAISPQIGHCSLPAAITSSNSASQKPASAEKWFPTSINTSVLPTNSFTGVCSLIQFILSSPYYVQRHWATHRQSMVYRYLHILFHRQPFLTYTVLEPPPPPQRIHIPLSSGLAGFRKRLPHIYTQIRTSPTFASFTPASVKFP